MILRQHGAPALAQHAGHRWRGISASVAIVVLGNFFRDAIEVIVDTQFNRAMRNDVAMWTVEPLPDQRARSRSRACPASRGGVLALRRRRDSVNGHRRERSQIRGYAAHPSSTASSTCTAASPRPGDGLVLTDRLADKLGVRVGDRLRWRCSKADRARWSCRWTPRCAR
jgi:putative ABC transport system permease protein